MDELDTLLADFNRLKKNCQELAGQKIVVGIVGSAGSDVLKIAHAHEYGATIKPKKANGYLAIPLTREAEAAGSPREFNDLRFVRASKGKLLMVRDKKKRGGKTGSEAMFLLVKSITLPERSFIRASFDAGKDKLGDIVDEQVNGVLAGKKSAKVAANAIGAQAAQMVQNFIDENRVSPPSDFSRKRVHTTLYETGTHIRDRISWKVEKK